MRKYVCIGINVQRKSMKNKECVCITQMRSAPCLTSTRKHDWQRECAYEPVHVQRKKHTVNQRVGFCNMHVLAYGTSLNTCERAPAYVHIRE